VGQLVNGQFADIAAAGWLADRLWPWRTRCIAAAVWTVWQRGWTPSHYGLYVVKLTINCIEISNLEFRNCKNRPGIGIPINNPNVS